MFEPSFLPCSARIYRITTSLPTSRVKQSVPYPDTKPSSERMDSSKKSNVVESNSRTWKPTSSPPVTITLFEIETHIVLHKLTFSLFLNAYFSFFLHERTTALILTVVISQNLTGFQILRPWFRGPKNGTYFCGWRKFETISEWIDSLWKRKGATPRSANEETIALESDRTQNMISRNIDSRVHPLSESGAPDFSFYRP